MQPAVPRHIAPIDGLRAVAVSAVILYHLHAAWLPGGFVGVDIFFVMSGFVVSLSLSSSGVTGLRQLLALFYSRRAVRILPGLYVCLLCSGLVSALFIPDAWLSQVAEKTGLAAIRGYSNVVLARSEGTYFAPRAEYNMFTQTWSLGVEEQFYAIFPWLFLPWLTGRRAWSAGVFAAALLLSLGAAYGMAGPHPASGFYLLFSRFWELALGVLAFQLSGAAPRGATTWLPHDRVTAALSVLCAAVVGLALARTPANATPWPGSLLPSLATACLLVLIERDAAWRGLSWLLSSPPSTAIGRISYSLYLWHWPVIVLFRWTVGLSAPWTMPLALALTTGAAWASYVWVETPPRQALSRARVSAGVALGVAAACVLLVYPLQKWVFSLRHMLSLTTVEHHRRDWYPDAGGRIVPAAGCAVRARPDPALPIAALLFTRTGCQAPPPQADRATHAGAAPPVGAALLVAARRAPGLFILGDSHAGAYWDLMADHVDATGGAGVLYYESGCPILGPKPNDTATCAAFIDRAVADILRRLRPGDVVFLPGLRIPRLTTEAGRVSPQQAIALVASQADWRAASTTATIPMLARLAAAGARIILEAPKPVFGAPGFRCADWFNRSNPICADGSSIPRALIETLRAPVMAQFAALVAAVPSVRVWDPMAVLCPGATCFAFDRNRPLFFDTDHLSGYGNRILEPSFAAFISK